MKKQSTSQCEDSPVYSGTAALFNVEEALKNYNSWIASKIHCHLNIRHSDAILDFGCGIGTLAALIQRQVCNEVVGVEIDPHLAETSVERGIKVFSSLAQCDLDVSGIFSSNVLEHIQDDEEVLRQFRAKLPVNSSIVLFVPAFPLLWTSMDDAVGHCRRYRASELISKVAGAGFRVSRWEYCDSVGFFASLMFKFTKNAGSEPSLRELKIYDKYAVPLTKILDRLFGKILGKNLLIVATTI
ncbi:class I SAM-dependent methyltransferase [Variovorax sp. LT1P1]|uniref:class I SAM-dependent methyltransferase n=1 Tax=Variovorax sp. LT1P1 TaxID=3443730 RepID=UPI003F47A1CE